ncbi:MAG TPA: hypothetical protein VLZ54_07085 [Arenibacter sp.]|nr:hypothetical protein [Arenibacter sp.]
MPTIFLNVGDYTANLYRDNIFQYAITQGEVVTIPNNMFQTGPNPWDPVEYHSIEIVPNGEVGISAVSIDPPETIEKGFMGDPELEKTWFWRRWANSPVDYIVNVTVEGDIINPAPYNRVYMVDAGIIEQFGNIAAFVTNGDGTVEYLLNNTDYIISLLNIPFKLHDEVAGAEENIKLGKVDTEISAPKVDPDVIRVPLGEIEVSGLQNNSLDYVQTEYTLVLPYIAETIPLNPEWVIDKTISVEYLFDSYSGNLTVNVFNGGDYPVTFITSNIGRMIPFKTLLTSPTEQGANMGAFNDTFAAYIRVARNEVYEGDFSNLVTVEGSISGQLGYVEVENIELNIPTLTSEKEMIIQALASGVIIK